MLVPGQRPQVHRLRRVQLPLLGVQQSRVVDRAQRRRMVRAQRLLPLGQRPRVYRLCSRPYENAAVLEQLGRCTSMAPAVLERA